MTTDQGSEKLFSTVQTARNLWQSVINIQVEKRKGKLPSAASSFFFSDEN